MIDKVRKYILQNHMIENGDHIVLGVSGGADSVALLLVLCELRAEWNLHLDVVHVHHGIREEAEADVVFVKRLCESVQVSCHVFYDDVPALAADCRMSEEEMGRQRRYMRFAEVAERTNAEKIAVAHHMDDQAETVLFHLSRGTDLSGMRGMLPVSGLPFKVGEGRMQVIRPLLNCRKEEMMRYLNKRQMTWQEDTTNKANEYARNRIRNLVIPELMEVNQQAVVHIAAFARQAAAYESFFEEQVARYMEEWVRSDEEGRLSLNRLHLSEEQPVFAQRVLYELLCRASGRKKDITAAHIEDLYGLLFKQSGRSVSLPYGLEAKVSYENLIIGKCSVKKEKEGRIYAAWDWQELIGKPQKTAIAKGMLYARVIDLKGMQTTNREILLNTIRNSKNNYTKYFGCDTIKSTLYIRKPESEDYMIIDRSGSRKRLSRYFIDEKIPKEARADEMLAAMGDLVLWVIGRRRSEVFPVCMDIQYILELRYEGVGDELSY